MIHKSSTKSAVETKANTGSRSTGFTIFSLPKPFAGHTEIIQRNAIKSWRSLSCNDRQVNIAILGDDPGTRETAAELEIDHLEGLQLNQEGTPVLSSAFRLAHEYSPDDVIIYINCDVILLEDFAQAVSQVQNSTLDEFVLIGRRTNLLVEREFDFDRPDEKQQLCELLKKNGEPGARVCKEYFAFTRGLYEDIPNFAVGRGNWDNWMVAHAKQHRIPVVNIDQFATVIHQTHDYGHAGQSRLNVYVSGREAKNNERLAGGKNVISGSSATWDLTRQGLRKRRFGWLNLDFWSDLPRFAGLLKDLWASRRDEKNAPTP